MLVNVKLTLKQHHNSLITKMFHGVEFETGKSLPL